MKKQEKIFMGALEVFKEELTNLIKVLIREQLNQKKETEIYYSVKDAAKLFGVTRVTVYNWMSKGKIKRIKMGGKVYVPQCEILNVRKNG